MKKIGQEIRRGYARTVVRVIGVALAVIGAGALPVGFGVSPKRDLSAFENAADLGAFVKPGLGLIGVGLVVVALSYLLPKNRIDG
jgi:hypothetical protein